MPKPKHWTAEFLKRGTPVPLAAQERHLEEARRKGIQSVNLPLPDPDMAYACARFAARAALRARPDLAQPSLDDSCDCMDCAINDGPTH
jgi:hypothetical protein